MNRDQMSERDKAKIHGMASFLAKHFPLLFLDGGMDGFDDDDDRETAQKLMEISNEKKRNKP